jgi:hypothetical protein
MNIAKQVVDFVDALAINGSWNTKVVRQFRQPKGGWEVCKEGSC